MWTATALASEAYPARRHIWRVVEHQHTASTRKLVSTHAEQALLESLLETSKPPYPPGTERLHYLLKTPFRYYPPRPYGSRFRRPGVLEGVFYASLEKRSAMAEMAICKAEDEKDYSEIDTLFNLLQKLFDEQPEYESYAGHPPEWANGIAMSCSS